MKKSSIETLLLLSNIQSKKQLAQFCSDIKVADADLLDVLLSELEAYKTRSFEAASGTLETQFARQKAKAEAAREEQRLRAEAERQRNTELNESVDQVLHLLLKRYKLKVPQAALELGQQLSSSGYKAGFDGTPTKPNLMKWVKQLCEQYPKGAVVNAAVDLATKYG